jgi:opacity protein-like surface antigen
MPARGASLLAVTLSALLMARAQATDWDASVDLRAVGADAPAAVADGGLGMLRYGHDRDGVQLGRARFALSQNLGDLLTFKADASAWGQHDRNPVDVTEAYLQLHPYPIGVWRARLKMGAFYAPLSLENRAAGWESPYTLSSSALDSWVAEELRTIGAELKVEWLGTHLGHDFDASAALGVYGWNQGSGTALTRSGFTITDWQGSLFGRVGRGSGTLGAVDEYHQYDNHAGTYEGLDVHYLDRVTLEALHYDNHANPNADDAVTGAYAWQTRFDTVGLRAEDEEGWTAIVQWMAGETFVAPDEVGLLGWKFVTRYVLVSKRQGRHTFSARYDDFKVDPDQAFPLGAEAGHAVTLAYRFEPNAHWRFTLEGVRAHGFQANRAMFLGEDPYTTQSNVQLAVRYARSNH